MEIRKMTVADLDRVCELERELFTMPWPRTSFLYEVSNDRAFPIVGVEDGEVVSYAIAWLVCDELHIGNIAVTGSRQGSGLGKLLLEHMLAEAEKRGAVFATLEVRASNARAISLYRSHGFKGIAIRKSYYTDNREDALIMMADIGHNRGRNDKERNCEAGH
jgi:ribosomal-protein-alanine N-acetyltransferase